MRILVADDSVTSLAIITAALNKLGHDVIGATSGKEAIEFFKQDKPDLVILDVVMQAMNGFECAKKLREIKSTDWIPIIFLSAAVDDESVSKGIDAGGDDYLTKPLSEVTLAAKIKAMQRISDMQKNLKELTQQLSILSTTDRLTGIYNRLQFEKSFKEKLSEAKRYNHILALLFLDLDSFKSVNDYFGHHVGDLLLIEVTKRLKACLRICDFIARLGGDEFAIILNKINNIKEAGRVAKKVLHELSPPYYVCGHKLKISGSIGISTYPMNGKSLIKLIQHADYAMYKAKKIGRNNFQYYTEDLHIDDEKRGT